MEKVIIGRIDRVDFPELNLFDIETKIDTGAYTSSIHCHNIVVLNDGKDEMVRFNLLDPSHSDYNEKEFVLAVHKRKQVKSSSGEAEERIFITTRILLFEQLFDVELSLTDRSSMNFPVLLGRKVLKKRFLVDVTKQDLSFKAKHSKLKLTGNRLGQK